MDLWPCDKHMEQWWKALKEKREVEQKKKKGKKEATEDKSKAQGKKRKRQDKDSAKVGACSCGPDAPRQLCRKFFESAREYWPMLWKDDRLRATAAACETHHDMPHLELDVMDPARALGSFFELDLNWTEARKEHEEADEYWRAMRRAAAQKSAVRRLDGLIGWHSLASAPAGTLAVLLNDLACKKKVPILYLWAPIVPTHGVGSIAWPSHYGTLMLVYKDWTSRQASRKAWSDSTFQAKYERCRASDHTIDDQAKVLCVPLLHFKDRKKCASFVAGTNHSGKEPSGGAKALKPAAPYLVVHGPTTSFISFRFAKDSRDTNGPATILTFEELHEAYTNNWVRYARPWRNMLAGLMSPHVGGSSQVFHEGTGDDGSVDGHSGAPPQPVVPKPAAVPRNLRQSRLNFSGDLDPSEEWLWPESSIIKYNIKQLKDWLLNDRQYPPEARHWKWKRVEDAVKAENGKTLASRTQGTTGNPTP